LLVLLPLRVSAAVTISSFDAKWQSGKVAVNWKTATELNNVGFNILRSTSPNGTFAKVNYTPTQCLGCLTGMSYSFIDSGVTPGQTYYYRLQSVNTSGVPETYSGTAVAAADATPTATATATRTRTPTVTATNIPSTPIATNIPSTPIATNIPSTPTATFAPQYTPTRTATYPPGVTPPSATPTSLRVVVAQPSPTTARAGAANPPAPPSIGGGTPAATRIVLAPQEPTPEDVTEEVENEVENSEESQNARDTRGEWVVRGGAFLLAGLLGLGALGLSLIAILLVVRFSRR
jgi:hypothetical protein